MPDMSTTVYASTVVVKRQIVYRGRYVDMTLLERIQWVLDHRSDASILCACRLTTTVYTYTVVDITTERTMPTTKPRAKKTTSPFIPHPTLKAQ